MCTERGSGDPGGTPATARPRRQRGDDPLWIVGLVGRAGSGKSTLARAFAARGFPVLDADRVGHEVAERDPEVRAALSVEHGPEVYWADGTLDRARVAARVFRDPAALARLNALVHPRIVAKLGEALDSLRERGYRGGVIVDAALILNWGFERECDLLVAVTAPEPELVSRLMRARGWSEEDIRARLAAQPTDERLAAAADLVLENRGSESELVETALREIAARMPAPAGEGRP
ncbi:MAG: dephospho-CoA kinase [Candidatus Eisenbacteria bacterium]